MKMFVSISLGPQHLKETPYLKPFHFFARNGSIVYRIVQCVPRKNGTFLIEFFLTLELDENFQHSVVPPRDGSGGNFTGDLPRIRLTLNVATFVQKSDSLRPMSSSPPLRQSANK